MIGWGSCVPAKGREWCCFTSRQGLTPTKGGDRVYGSRRKAPPRHNGVGALKRCQAANRAGTAGGSHPACVVWACRTV